MEEHRLHGGCCGCVEPLRICPGCYYFDSDSEKLVLNPEEIKRNEEDKRLRERAIKEAEEWKVKNGRNMPKV